MQQRSLGMTGTHIGAIGQGCALFSEGYGTPEDSKSMAALETALESGVTLFDTADAYGIGHNEELLGRFLHGRRNRAVIATKVGLVRKPGSPPAISNSPEYLRSACEASLRRLGVDTIDLYYLQRRDPEVPLEDVIGAMAGLVREGKVRYLGLSEVSAQTLQRACSVHPISALQSEYSLWSRGPEASVLGACRALGVSFVAYCPLGRAFLSGDITSTEELDPNDFRRRMPRFQTGALEKNRELLSALTQLAAARKATRAQISLAWLLSKYPNVVPIPGSRQPRHVLENAAAADITLSLTEIQQLDTLFPPAAIVGARLPAPAMVGIED